MIPCTANIKKSKIEQGMLLKRDHVVDLDNLEVLFEINKKYNLSSLSNYD